MDFYNRNGTLKQKENRAMRQGKDVKTEIGFGTPSVLLNRKQDLGDLRNT